MILATQTVAEQIADLVLYATAVTLGVSISFALALIGTMHATDARREQRTLRAVPWTILALLGYVAVLVCAAKGILVVMKK